MQFPRSPRSLGTTLSGHIDLERWSHQSARSMNIWGRRWCNFGTQGHPGNQLTDGWQDLHTSDLGGLEAPF